MILAIAAVIGILCAVSLICSIYAVKFGADALIEVEAMKRSTHQITYIDPTKQNFSSFGEDARADLAKSDDTLESIQ